MAHGVVASFLCTGNVTPRSLDTAQSLKVPGTLPAPSLFTSMTAIVPTAVVPTAVDVSLPPNTCIDVTLTSGPFNISLLLPMSSCGGALQATPAKSIRNHEDRMYMANLQICSRFQ